MHILWIIFIGFVVGLIAKLLTPGRGRAAFLGGTHRRCDTCWVYIPIAGRMFRLGPGGVAAAP
jgi:hypothetical protein